MVPTARIGASGKTAVRAAALILALGFLAILLSSQWQALQSYQWTLRPGWALLSLVVLGVAWLFELSVWRFILSKLGGHLPWYRAAQTWFLSNIVRYIPGNVWQFLSMAELAADDGVGRISTLASIMLHQVLSTIAGLVLAALYFAVAGQGAWLETIRPLLWLVPLGLLFTQPRWLERILNLVLRRLGRPILQVRLNWRQIWLVLLGYAAVWLIAGGSFALLAAGLTPLSLAEVPSLVAVWAAAYVIGFLSLLTPSGIGVREGVMILLLTPLLPAPLPTVLALAARLWMILGEIAGAGWALVARGSWPLNRRPKLAEDGPQ